MNNSGMFVLPSEGMQIPMHRISHLAIKVSIKRDIKIEYVPMQEGGTPSFILSSQEAVTFSNFLYLMDGKEPMLYAAETTVLAHPSEDLLASELFAGLGKNSLTKLREILDIIVSRSSRITNYTHNLTELQKIVADENNPQIKELKKKRRGAQRKLDEAYGELATFEEKKSEVVADNISIKEFSTMEKYWIAEVRDMYESMLNGNSSFDMEDEEEENDHDDDDNDSDIDATAAFHRLLGGSQPEMNQPNDEMLDGEIQIINPGDDTPSEFASNPNSQADTHS